ncbi:MAG TPA: segregation/condensation protein A [Enhygromyxa sp.]|nr:segregation/condensation protein A [Enhygromyxa sp.]
MAAIRTSPSRPATDSIADGVRSRPTYAVSLEMFEGPLDLLLHLVRRHELDILDIPIAFITEKYIEYITFARSLDIEIAGEYLLMAATLAFLKSRELLPPTPGEDEESEDEEEGVDPREELIRRLIEYERFRDASEELGNRPLFGRDVFPRGGSPDVVLPEPGLAPVTLFRLAEAYNRVLDRAKIREDHEVVIEPVTVRQRMRQLSLLLSDRPRIEFESLFLEQTWSSERELRQMLVVTLMSVLEMVKLGLLGVHQPQGSETLELERTVEVAEMSEAISVFREEGEEDEPAAAASEVAVEAEPEAASEVAVEAELVAEAELEAASAIAAEAELVVESEADEPEPEPVAEPEPEPSEDSGPEPVKMFAPEPGETE